MTGSDDATFSGFPRASDQSPEVELVDAARSGSSAAFGELVDRYYPALLTYLLRLAGDRDWALDLTQESFLDAFRALDRLPEDSSFRAWLFVIARNNYRHDLRRRRVRQIISLDWLLSHRRRSLPPAEDDALRVAERHSVQQALNRMSPAIRETLVLLSLGYTLREIAEMLDIAHSTARKRASRGLRQLEAILSDDPQREDS